MLFNYQQDGVNNKGQLIEDEGPQFLSTYEKENAWVTAGPNVVAGSKQQMQTKVK
jgi:hypothetical protein